jgi:hypothetical protein
MQVSDYTANPSLQPWDIEQPQVSELMLPGSSIVLVTYSGTAAVTVPGLAEWRRTIVEMELPTLNGRK